MAHIGLALEHSKVSIQRNTASAVSGILSCMSHLVSTTAAEIAACNGGFRDQ